MHDHSLHGIDESVPVMPSNCCSGGRHADKVMRLGECGEMRRIWSNQRHAACRLRRKDSMIGPKTERSRFYWARVVRECHLHWTPLDHGGNLPALSAHTKRDA